MGLSEEAKRRISIKNRGRKRTEEWKARYSIANLVINSNPMFDPEIRRKVSEKLKGIKYSDSRRKNISMGVKKYYENLTEDEKEKIRIKHRGCKWSEESKRKLSETLKKNYKDNPELRSKVAASKGKKCSAEHKLKVAQSKKNYWSNPSNRERAKNRFRDSEFCLRWAKAHSLKPNKLELQFQDFLSRLFPNEYKYVGDFQFTLGGKCPDFMNINGQKKLIELFGNYWHKEDNSEERIEHFKQYGFDTLVIWENDFLNSRAQVERQLLAFHSKPKLARGQAGPSRLLSARAIIAK